METEKIKILFRRAATSAEEIAEDRKLVALLDGA